MTRTRGIAVTLYGWSVNKQDEDAGLIWKQAPNDVRTMSAQFYVYIATNESRTLYVGVTNNLERRMSEHRQKLVPGFTAKYNISKLVYYTTFPSAKEVIQYEKVLKGWVRKKKVALIQEYNPTWCDIAIQWDK